MKGWHFGLVKNSKSTIYLFIMVYVNIMIFYTDNVEVSTMGRYKESEELVPEARQICHQTDQFLGSSLGELPVHQGCLLLLLV